MSDHPIPAGALAQHLAIIGKTGSGKSWAARGIVENILDAGGRVCIIDPTSAWWGLRSSASGKSGGYNVVIFGGSHPDLPLAGNHGEAIAETLGGSSTPAIIDCSLLRLRERTQFFTDFADALLRKNRGPLHLVIDEAHLFAPQGKVADPQSGQMLHAANNLVSLGRSRGLRIMLITQRPAKLHKDSLTQVETLVAMRLIAPQDRKAVEEWIKDNADAERGREIITSLAMLKTGQGWVWAPELNMLERVTFPRIRTFDSSRAPDEHEDASQVLARIDKAAIAEKLRAVGVEAEANDPKLLRKRVADLEQDLAIAQHAGAQVSPEDLQAAEARGYARRSDEMFANIASAFDGVVERAAGGLRDVFSDLRSKLQMAAAYADASAPVPPARIVRRVGRAMAQLPPPPASPRSPSIDEGDSTVEQRILNALAELEQLGAGNPGREMLAFMSGYAHPRSQKFVEALGALLSQERISYPRAGEVGLTVLGREDARAPARPRNSRELQERIIGKLGGVSGQILEPLVRAYPKAIARADLATASGYQHVRSQQFVESLGRLAKLGFVEYPTPGMVTAASVLFLR